ncbi:MAG: hypothetical protein V4733_08855 [Verrucomicrobiota bacterium]
MSIGSIALQVIESCEASEVDHMVTGAFAFNYYGIPRSTKDFDVVIDVRGPASIPRIMDRLENIVEFNGHVQFDTLTWGRRHIGRCVEMPGFVIELFELFDDPFVQEQFRRRLLLESPQLGRSVWLPTAEDVVVRKLRWGRSKDLDDARDVLAVQGPETLDMPYIRGWCAKHTTTERLEAILESLPTL